MTHLYIGMEYADTKVAKIKPTARGTREFPSVQLTMDDGSIVYEGDQWGQGKPTVIQREEPSSMLPFVGSA